MKPILIYTMSRTKGTATLEASKRTYKNNEPFEAYNLSTFVEPFSYMNMIKTIDSYDNWDGLFQKLNVSDSATKIFGHGLQYCYPARSWFSMAQQTHETFILVRNVREMIISELLAPHFGFNKTFEKENTLVTINENQFTNVSQIILCFLRFYPSNGQLVTFETLPSDYFDKSMISCQEQDSQAKVNLISNFAEVETNINAVMSFHAAEWKEKTGLDIFA